MRLVASRFRSPLVLVVELTIASLVFAGFTLACRLVRGRLPAGNPQAFAWLCWIAYAVPGLFAIGLLVGAGLQGRERRLDFAAADRASVRFPRLDLSIPRAAVSGLAWIGGSVEEAGEIGGSLLAAVVHRERPDAAPDLTVFLEPKGWSTARRAVARWASAARIAILPPIKILVAVKSTEELIERARAEVRGSVCNGM